VAEAAANDVQSARRLAGVALAMAAAALALSVWAITAARHHGPPPPPPPTSTAGASNAASPTPKPVASTAPPSVAPADRSPLPQPGETIVKPFPVQTVAPPQSPASAAPLAGQTVPWDQAAKYIGQTVTVEGKVLATFNTGSVCFLNFSTDPRGGDKFYLIIFKGLFNAWPQPPEKQFLNKTVRATGQIDLHQGRPQIKINKKEQIEVVE
jgi:hypothetical protein